jgi:uncharacterized protein YecE (DUF72 family)
MKFGELEPTQLRKVDFSLPDDTEATRRVLGQSHTPNCIVRIGGAKWGRPDWKGKFYPHKTKHTDFLHHYSRALDTIEMNSLFYKIQPTEIIENWVATVPDGFEFCPKFYQGITHIRRLKHAEDWTDAFLRSISGFGNHLGPAFLQLANNFAPKSFDVLESYLQSLPNDLKLYVEVRHKDWFEPENAERLYALLQWQGYGWVLTDTSGRRDCLHMNLPIPSAFIRYVGNNLHRSDYRRIDAWAERILKWKTQGIESVYFFIHQHDERWAPELMRYTIKKFNDVCGLAIPVPAKPRAPRKKL